MRASPTRGASTTTRSVLRTARAPRGDVPEKSQCSIHRLAVGKRARDVRFQEDEVRAVRYIIPAIQDLVATRKGQSVRPLDDFQTGRKALNLVGYEGVTMIAVAGLDMAAWDALAKAAGMPLAVMLGGSVGPVPAYNSHGLWLNDVGTLGKEAVDLVAEGQFKGLKSGWAAIDWKTTSPPSRRCATPWAMT